MGNIAIDRAVAIPSASNPGSAANGGCGVSVTMSGGRCSRRPHPKAMVIGSNSLAHAVAIARGNGSFGHSSEVMGLIASDGINALRRCGGCFGGFLPSAGNVEPGSVLGSFIEGSNLRFNIKAGRFDCLVPGGADSGIAVNTDDSGFAMASGESNG